ncbi:MAG: efflux RND transporter periplasmic adaptor subunit [Saprospiraceae bacterium]
MTKIFLTIIAATALFLTGCQNPVAPTETPMAAEASTAPDEIRLTAAQVSRAGIETGSFSARALSETLSATAELVVGKEHNAIVSAFADCALSELRVSLNQTVQRGAVVAMMRKPDLLDLQQQYLENKNQLAFLQTEFERYQALSKADATASKNSQRAESELRAAQTTGKVLAAKLRQYQINPDRLDADHLKTELPLIAPVSGTVTRIHASAGTALALGTPVCEIVDFSQLHPVIFVFEQDIFRVKNGQKVWLNFPAEPSKAFPAKVYNIERTVDADRKAVRVHARFDATPPANWIAGAYVDARIELSGNAPATALPKEAIIREGEADYIFIEVKTSATETIFRKVKVRSGATDGTFTAATPETPLPTNAKIALKGAYYISAQGAGIEVEE